MSSNYLDIPGRKDKKLSASSDDDDHSFIILGSSSANSLSYDREIEFLSESRHLPVRENVALLDDTDLETLINSELDDKDNDFNSIPEICESLMATIRPGSVMSLEENYTNVLRENLEEIVMRFKQLTGSEFFHKKILRKYNSKFLDHLHMTRELLNSQLALRRNLLEKSKEVVQATRMNERLREENQDLSKELEICRNKNRYLLKKFRNLREKTEYEHVATKKTSSPRKIFYLIFMILFVIIVFRVIFANIMER